MIQLRTLASSPFPTPPSATGRARKRRRRIAKQQEKQPRMEPKQQETIQAAYPPGRPWRVLWPHPHGDPVDAPKENKRKIPRWQDLKNAWRDYKSTWTYGLRGVSHDETETNNVDIQQVAKNASRNIQDAQTDAQALFQSSAQSGIQSTQDLRQLATDYLKLATTCLQEFMAGYRQGRDEEMERMLNEYFQEKENSPSGKVKRRRRKPKRVNLRE